jgi:hypothetical protein
MAPEQSERSGRIGPQTDVWPLGLIVFYLLTGRPYWLSANDGTTSLPTLMREVLFESVAPPSQRAAALGCAALWPPALDGWFLRIVERDPQRRERDVDAVVSGLEQALRSAPPVAPRGALPVTQVGSLAASHATWAPPARAPAAQGGPSRRALLFAAGAVVAAAAGVGGAAVLWSRTRPVKVVEAEAPDAPRPRRRTTDCQVLAALVQRVSDAAELPSPRATVMELERLRDGLDAHAADAPWKDDARRALDDLLEARMSAHHEPSLWMEFIARYADRCPDVRAVVEAGMAPEPPEEQPEVADDDADP